MIISLIGIIPLMSFILLSGFVILYLHSAWKVDLINIVFFVAGAFLAAIGMGLIMTLAAPQVAVCEMPVVSRLKISLLILFATCVVTGGYYGVSAWHRIMKKKMSTDK